MTTALVIIDVQQDYFPGGAFALPAAQEAGVLAAEVLARARASGAPVLHVQHVWDSPEATFMRPGTDGVGIHPLVAPVDGEPVIMKEHPNAFLETPLEAELRARGIDRLLVLGMMSNMCVDATVRAASDLGFAVTVTHDACAAADLEFGGVAVPAGAVHAAFMAALDDTYADMVAAADADLR